MTSRLLDAAEVIFHLRVAHVCRLAQLIAVIAVGVCVGFEFWTAAIVLLLAAILAQLVLMERGSGT